MQACGGGNIKDYTTYSFSVSEMIQTLLLGFFGSFFLLYLFYHHYITCFFGGVLGAVGYLFYQKHRLAQQQKWKLMVEFKDAMDSMISALVAGYSMENAIGEAYHDMFLIQGKETAMISELRDIKAKLSLQHTLDELLLDLGRRSGVEDIIIFAQIYATARRSGGNLVKVMKRTAENIGEKIEMQREIQTMISGKKMEANCMMVIPLLIILYLHICSPGFLDPLYGNFMGVLFMTVVLIVYMVSILWSRHIMNIQG